MVILRTNCRGVRISRERGITMSKPVVITADSTVDLSAELLERYDIKTIPLTIILGEDSFPDGEELCYVFNVPWMEGYDATLNMTAQYKNAFYAAEVPLRMDEQ